jgi:hypothetical protein
VGGLKRPWSRISQVLGIPNKELSRDTKIAKKQQSFIEGENKKVLSSRRGSGF